MIVNSRQQLTFPSPLGPITLESNGDCLTALSFGDHGGVDNSSLLLEAQKQLNAYFSGLLRTFTLPLFYNGTAFQNRVWTVLGEISYGKTISYRELAQRIDCPKGFQAVGGANSRNPLPILIPCHRVIAHNGGLGGYSGGLDAKRFLLNLEELHT